MAIRFLTALALVGILVLTVPTISLAQVQHQPYNVNVDLSPGERDMIVAALTKKHQAMGKQPGLVETALVRMKAGFGVTPIDMMAINGALIEYGDDSAPALLDKLRKAMVPVAMKPHVSLPQPAPGGRQLFNVPHNQREQAEQERNAR